MGLIGSGELWFLQGFGGQFEYFGLWLDAAYGQGHSRTKTLCTTYNSPVLSAQENFKIDTLEIYGVGEVQSHDEDEEVVLIYLESDGK